MNAQTTKLELNCKLIIERCRNERSILYLPCDDVNINLCNNLGSVSDDEFSKVSLSVRKKLSTICLYEKTKWCEATFRVFKNVDKGYKITCTARGVLYDSFNCDTWHDAKLIVNKIERPHCQSIRKAEKAISNN